MTENNQNFEFPQIFKLPSIACLSEKSKNKRKSSSSNYNYLRSLISQQLQYNKPVKDQTEYSLIRDNSPSYESQIGNPMKSVHKYRELMKMIRSKPIKPIKNKYSKIKVTKNEASLDKKQFSFEQFNKYNNWNTISVNKISSLNEEKNQNTYESSSQILKNIKINRSKTQMQDTKQQKSLRLHNNLLAFKRIKIKFPCQSILRSNLDKVQNEENCSIRHSLQPSKSLNEELNQRSNFGKKIKMLEKRPKINLNFRGYHSQNQSKLLSPCYRLTTQIAGWTVSEFKD